MLPLNKKNTNWQFTANVTINFHFSKLFITFFHLTIHTLTSHSHLPTVEFKREWS